MDFQTFCLLFSHFQNLVSENHKWRPDTILLDITSFFSTRRSAPFGRLSARKKTVFCFPRNWFFCLIALPIECRLRIQSFIQISQPISKKSASKTHKKKDFSVVDLDLNIKVYQESEATLFKIPEVTRNELLMNSRWSEKRFALEQVGWSETLQSRLSHKSSNPTFDWFYLER